MGNVVSEKVPLVLCLPRLGSVAKVRSSDTDDEETNLEKGTELDALCPVLPSPTLRPKSQQPISNVPRFSDFSASTNNAASAITTSLETQYKSEESWMYPLFFDRLVRFEQEDYYVPLEVDHYSRSGDFIKKSRANMEGLFDPILEGCDRVTRVLLRGRAGFGKSCLCQYIVYCWAHSKDVIRALPSEDVVPVLFKIRDLTEDDDIERRLVENIHACHLRGDPNATQDLTEHFIRSYAKRIVLIIDGYDEVRPEQRENVTRFLDPLNDSIFRFASVLVTTRPGEDVEDLDFDKKYSICQLNEEQVNVILDKFCKSDSKQIDYIGTKIEELSYKNELDFSPFMISVLCCLYKKETLKELRTNIVDNFGNLAFSLLELHKEQDSSLEADDKNCPMFDRAVKEGQRDYSDRVTSKEVCDKMDFLSAFAWICKRLDGLCNLENNEFVHSIPYLGAKERKMAFGIFCERIG